MRHIELRRQRLRAAGFSGNSTNMEIAFAAIGDPDAARSARSAGIFVPDDEELSFELIDAMKSQADDATTYLQQLDKMEIYLGDKRLPRWRGDPTPLEQPFAKLADVRCFIDFSNGRTRSRGGRYSEKRRTEQSCDLFDPALDRGKRGPGISIAFARNYLSTVAWQNQLRTTHPEYARIRLDPEIGSFLIKERTDIARAVVLHEVAHAAQHTRQDLNDAPHGCLWQGIYRQLRREFGFVEPHRMRPAAPRCEHCNSEFAPRRKDGRFCSSKCRTASRRANPEQIGEHQRCT